MSFSSDAKAELCQAKTDRKCCAVAECYGVLLYCNTFSTREIRIITASGGFAARLPKLLRRGFGLRFDSLPDAGTGKKTLIINDRDKLARIFSAFGSEPEGSLSHHINFGVIEEDCCRTAFVRGAFLAGGSVTDPEKRYHLELATPHRSVSREMFSVLLDMGFSPQGDPAQRQLPAVFQKGRPDSGLFYQPGRACGCHECDDRQGGQGNAQYRHPPDQL